ncbi:hypothetical protein [Paraburkholderia sp. BL10I2N1]|uniref:hypothetical protein n=1 Tax=Paraburkholderia sp. BL10I2N1 TaxID=1938796 RepID=UPI00105CB9A8|nr:hypothetical protein [Paraburkholderia sp. BL10I2N1]
MSSEMLERSPHREALQTVDVSNFRTGVDVLFVRGSLPGRLTRAADLLRGALAESGLAMHLENPQAGVAGRPAEANPAWAI